MGTKCSLITMYNDKTIAREFEENLATQQEIDYELISIDNYSREYASIREAYNEAFQKSCGEYIVFLHPDIRFLANRALADIIHRCEEIKDFGVVGIAGAAPGKRGERVVYSSIVHGENKVNPGELICDAKEIQTVDECLFIVKREVFARIGFAKKEGFHLYAVEYCLDMILEGRTNYAVPAQVWHMSSGKSMDPSYVVQLEEVLKVYRKNFDVIYTTVKKWPTRGFWSCAYRKYYYVKRFLEQ